ncbi:glutaredoxin domain-containing protein [Nocardia asteroides]|uniref:glutaredoxin domain-containing protein n=1 Tax=Nocardia asteroides TaxID=1824 RepID=UPI0037CBA793
MATTTVDKIERQLAENPIMLYMKGSPNQPDDSRSARAVQAVLACGVKFSHVDILQNPDIRGELPKYSKLQAFPQLWVDRKLVGGIDTISEMYETGELQTLLEEAAAKRG